MSGAREEILGRLRERLGRLSIGPELPWTMGVDGAAPGAPVDLGSEALRGERFREMLERSGGHFHSAGDEAEATTIVEKICRGVGSSRIAVSDARAARVRSEVLADRQEIVPHDAGREELFTSDVGLTTAQWAVAETGTIVLLSAAEHHRLVSLLPPVHIAIVEAKGILASLDDLLRELGGVDPAEISRTITMITGPSRTANIEFTPVIGMHGPRELHVIVL
jgi:L-lactate dehydrogenase complex protein LldG